jgi:GH24 family phage-related lysozyme (muramidase)
MVFIIMMIPSRNCIDFIKQRERFVPHAYQDVAGIWTIGYGSILHANGQPVRSGDVIDTGEADVLLRMEVNEKSRRVSALLHDIVVTQNMYDALVSFAYNAGTGALQQSTLLIRVRNNPRDTTIIDYSDAHPAAQSFMRDHGMTDINTIQHEFMKWVYAYNPHTKKKEIVLGLQNRRNLEWQLYQS